MALLSQFFIKPESRAPNIEVYVWPTYAELRLRARADRVRDWRRAMAYSKVYQESVDGSFAEMHFCRKALGIIVLTHEVGHVILGLAQLKKFEDCLGSYAVDGSQATDKEERLCNALGASMDQLVTGLKENGF